MQCVIRRVLLLFLLEQLLLRLLDTLVVNRLVLERLVQQYGAEDDVVLQQVEAIDGDRVVARSGRVLVVEDGEELVLMLA